MKKDDMKAVAQTFRKHEKALYEGWMASQLASASFRPDLMKEAQLREQSHHFFNVLLAALDRGFSGDIAAETAAEVRDFLNDLSRSRAHAGYTPTETATFVFSLKQPAFEVLRKEYAGDQQNLADTLWNATVLLDKLGLYTTEVYR
ncbi:MAG TPA: RsbRD N-terminal domain-containing protein, partial [Burkholderiales bacterium]|nr:RsbRD N-terminal domain-containing protein [Burkholderiales bacterium]